MAIDDNFAVFILTHGRPGKVKTYDTLQKQGYTGPLYIIIDNEDKTAPAYKKRFGDKVIVFDKSAIAQKFDTGDNFQERRAVVFARNACFEIAKDLGLEYFLQLDDDYSNFCYKFDSDLMYINDKRLIVKNLDRLFGLMLEYYKGIEVKTVAFAQTGDIIGGANNDLLSSLKIKRKAMNTFFCSTLRPFEFVGRVNEDVNTYTSLGNRGELIFTINNVFIYQLATQANSGGMTDLYLNEGTYVKSFYTVMYAPSCTRIVLMGKDDKHKRLHHRIRWARAVPCIIGEEYRKTGIKTPELIHQE